MTDYVTYDELFRDAWLKVLAPNNVIPSILKRKLNEMGIAFTHSQWAKIRSQIEKSIKNSDEGLKLDIDDEVLIQAGFEPDEKGNFNLTIDLTDEAEKLTELQTKLPDLLADLLPKIVDEWAVEKQKQFEEESLTILETEREARDEFHSALRNIWGKALDQLELFIILVTEAGSEFANETTKSVAAKNPDYVLSVLIGLHARACQIAKEIHTLLNAGLADGAHARWRTLHELSVIAHFIQEHGQETAERYLLHEAIESRKAAHQHARFASRLTESAPSNQELQQLDELQKNLIERFGKEFKEQYGWAANLFPHRKPNFADIEKAVSLDHMRPYYRLASHNVHANPKGINFRLGTIPNTKMVLAGPSVYGLADPGHGVTISLLQITTWLLSYKSSIDRLVRLRTLQIMENKIGELFSEGHWKMQP